MVVTDTEMMSHREVDSSPAQPNNHQGRHGGGENHPFSSLGRQSSIYSLTLDEFQHALCENGKNFGSMNMDEFLVSIWNAEENNQQAAASNSHHHQHQHQNQNQNQDTTSPLQPNNTFNNNGGNRVETGLIGGSSADSGKRTITKQPSLPRQGSLTLPAPLCSKTVDEVWSEIHKGHNNGGGESNGHNQNATQNGETAARQPTFGEMTLEDFLVKAGVVREQPTNPKPNQNSSSIIPNQQQQQIYGVFQDPSFPTQSMAVGDPSGYMNKRTGGGGGGGYQQGTVPVQVPVPVQSGVCYGGRVGTNGGYGTAGQVGMVGPLSPVSSDGLGHGQVDNIGQYGVEIGGLRGRKRGVDGPVEKVVERRQRRMIKNRESAARSRARKQAYTVELEAELNQLKEENSQLKHALAELERKRKQQYFESLKTRTQSKVAKVNGRLRPLKRNPSCPL